MREVTGIAITELQAINGVSAIESSILKLQPEVAFKLTADAVALGLSNADVLTQICNALSGQQVYNYQVGGEEVDVVVKLANAEADIQTFLENLMIDLSDGTSVPAGILAAREYAPTETEIVRVDGIRFTDIVVDGDKDLLSTTQVSEAMEAYLQVSFTLEGEANAQAGSINGLMYSGMLALFAIYALMAIPLKSYFQPQIIFSIVPFSMVGALWGHYIMDIAVSTPSFLGLIAMFGVVINDSLVLATTANKQIAEGADPRYAIKAAGIKRFRPVILTSITTFAGLMPLLFETSRQRCGREGSSPSGRLALCGFRGSKRATYARYR